MCGLVGFIRRPGTMASAEYIAKALWADSVRGMDSTGIAFGDIAGDEFKEPQIIKKPIHGADFISLESVQKILKKNYDYYLGHNRKSTNGTISEFNAHPFHIEHIVLAHNGHMMTTYNLPKTPAYDSKEPTLIDSAKIAYSMAHGGEKATLEKLDGAFALTWINLKTHTLNIATNGERPLNFVYEKGVNGLYWASEYTMLEWLTDHVQIDREETILHPKPYVWYRLPLTDLRKYQSEKFEKYERPSYSYGTSSSKRGVGFTNNEGWEKDWDDNAYSYTIPHTNGLFTMVGQKKAKKLLNKHGLAIGDVLAVRLTRFIVVEGKHLAKYDIIDDRVKAFSYAVQSGRSLNELRTTINKPHDKRIERACIIGLSSDTPGKHLKIVIGSTIDMPVPEKTQEALKLLPQVTGDDETAEIVLESDIINMVRGPNDLLIPIGEWARLTQDGCAKCKKKFAVNDDITWEQVEEVGKKPVYILWCETCAPINLIGAVQ